MDLRNRAKSGELDYLWGRERHPDSPSKGQVVAPVIFLWNRPPVWEDIRVADDGSFTLTRGERHVIAVAEHGCPVRLIDQVEGGDSRDYYHVRVPPGKGEWVGRIRRFIAWITRREMTGWVSVSMLLHKGRPYWEQAA